jgi:hypothetical protein
METVNHYHSVRIRVNGSGNLRGMFYSLDDVNSQVLTPLAMQSLTNIQPTILLNFKEQRAALEFKTTEIDETFRIGKIIIFVKPLWTSYPQ